jgi:hypothetical protein
MTERQQISIDDIRQNCIVVISHPRFGPLGPVFQLVEAVAKFGLRVKPKGDSVYWDQSMTRAMETTLAMFDQQSPDENQVIMTMDYDTVFHPHDLGRLYGFMKAAPDADAICALQMRRECREMLIMAKDDNGNARETLPGDIFADPLVKVSAGHFGLTAIRASSLRDLPRPWFCAKPDNEGRWGEGHVDADVSFWHAWEATGRTLYCCHASTVGHGQWMYTWPGTDAQPLHQYAADYQMNGKPATAWGQP